jgi:hypothetical protein
MADDANPGAAAAETVQEQKARAQVKLDTSQLKSSYCNVANVMSTREEVIVNFGVNHNWDLNQKGMDVELLHRVILSPFAAKRLSTLLGKLLQEYESRHGNLA